MRAEHTISEPIWPAPEWLTHCHRPG